MSSKDAIVRLDAAVSALGDVDVSSWSDDTLRSHLDELSAALCQVEAQLARVAEAVRARGFTVSEPQAEAARERDAQWQRLTDLVDEAAQKLRAGGVNASVEALELLEKARWGT